MIFVFDLDGTICFKGKPVSENILRQLEALQAEGHTVIFASARPIRDMLPVLDRRFHTYTMIGGNGSLISQQGRLTHATPFSGEQVSAIRSLLAQSEATYLIDAEWDYTYTGAPDHPILNNLDPTGAARNVGLDEHKSIVKALVLTAADMDELANAFAALDVAVHRHRHEQVLDVSPKHIHKWAALSKLGVEPGSYVAFGNDANDMTMFMNAAHSVMIGHHEELAAHATESIPLGDDVERRIVDRLRELAVEWR